MPLRRRCSLYSVMLRWVPGVPVGGAEVSSKHSSVDTFNSGQRHYIEADCSTVISALASQETQCCSTSKALMETLLWGIGRWSKTQLVTSCYAKSSKVRIRSNMCRKWKDWCMIIHLSYSYFVHLLKISACVCKQQGIQIVIRDEKYNLGVKKARSWSNYANRILLHSMFISFIIFNVLCSPVGKVVLMRQALNPDR